MLVKSEDSNEAIIEKLDKQGFIWLSIVGKEGEEFKIEKTLEWEKGNLVLCLFKKELHVMAVRKDTVLEDKNRVIFVYPKYIFGKITQKRSNNHDKK